MSAETFTSTLPIAIIDTNGIMIKDEPKIDATLIIINSSEKNPITFDTSKPFFSESKIDYEGNIGIEIRGGSSQMFPKKAFGFETRDLEGESIDVSIFGFPQESDWILAGPFNDRSLIRNSLGYKLWSATGRYAPRSTFVELFLNNNNASDLNKTYFGVYQFNEKIKRSEERIDIKKMSSDCNSGECLTGGYIIKIDAPKKEDAFFVTQEGRKAIIEYPKSKNINDEQKQYIENYYLDFEKSFDKNSVNYSQGAYEEYIDTNSFIDYLIVAELAKSVEGFSFNFFLTKDNGEKLTAGPAWDFDRAFGNEQTLYSFEAQGWLLDSYPPRIYHHPQFWWYELLDDPIFAEKLSARWKELRMEKYSDAALSKMIEDDIKLIGLAQERNFEKWNIIEVRVGSNPPLKPDLLTYDDQISYLKNWLITRANWIDAHIDSINAICGNAIIEDGEDCDFGADNNISENHCLERLCSCDFGFEVKNGQCVPIQTDYICPKLDLNANVLCPDDDLGLTKVWKPLVMVSKEDCSIYSKCEYYCAQGFIRKGFKCVIDTRKKEIIVNDEIEVVDSNTENNIQQELNDKKFDLNFGNELTNELKYERLAQLNKNNTTMDYSFFGFIILTIIILTFTFYRTKLK